MSQINKEMGDNTRVMMLNLIRKSRQKREKRNKHILILLKREAEKTRKLATLIMKVLLHEKKG